MRINLHIEEINRRLTMKDVINKYHDMGKIQRTKCPFHDGIHNNFAYNNKFYHCWVCGEKGNLFTFVKKLFNLNTKLTIMQINYDFNLGLPLSNGYTLRERQKSMMKHKEKLEKQKREEEEKQKKDDLYFEALKEYDRLEENKNKYTPTIEDFETGNINDEYVEACNNIDYQEHLVNLLDYERRRNGGK